MSRQIRRSILAGQWYPGTARELERTIEAFFANVEPASLDGQVVGLICPHAGYPYSGQTAAYAYSQVRGASFDVVAVISPLHRLPLGRFAVNSATAYETPLGLVQVAQDLVDALDREVGVNRVAQDGEHSIEIQLPFLQVALDDINLLPIMVGESSFEAGIELGRAMAGMLEGKKALIVASSDMHHIDNYTEVVRRDQVVIEAIDSFDMARIQKALSPWDCSVCGRIPIYAMLTAAQSLSADQVKILHHTTSGDVTGMRMPGQYTVGYLAAAVYRQQ
jgi:AmmeMemoRadiSam system protein B